MHAHAQRPAAFLWEGEAYMQFLTVVVGGWSGGGEWDGEEGAWEKREVSPTTAPPALNSLFPSLLCLSRLLSRARLGDTAEGGGRGGER